MSNEINWWSTTVTTIVKKTCQYCKTNLAEMSITHKFKCDFIVHEKIYANILHGLQKIGIHCVLMI